MIGSTADVMGADSDVAGAGELAPGTGAFTPGDAADAAAGSVADRRDVTRSWPRRSLVALQLLGVVAWLLLVGWRLTRVPGMSMDEGWFIACARGRWPTVNPLSGMTTYTGQFPILILRAFGPSAGLGVLRWASVVAHAALLVVLALLLRSRFERRQLAGWALPVVATCPAWLISARIGIEVTMFNGLFVFAGLYFMSRGRRWWTFAGGVCWGLAIYNHVLGLFGVLAAMGAWLIAYRQWRTVAWGALAAGLGVGLAPRLLSLILYDNTQLVGTASSLSLAAAVADLRWTPSAIWEALHGRTLYLRYVGRVAREIAPYWLAGAGVLVPWLRHWRALPRVAVFSVAAFVLCSIITTLGSPYLETRYIVLPVLGVPLAFVVLGAAAIERDRRSRYLVWSLATVIVAGNVYYELANFYVPWSRQELASTSFRMGTRSPPIGSWHFLPKERLARELTGLAPAPEQIVAPPSLQRPLEALLNTGDTALRIVPPTEADPKLRSVYVDYRTGAPKARQCVRLGRRNVCFVEPAPVDEYYVVYRAMR